MADTAIQGQQSRSPLPGVDASGGRAVQLYRHYDLLYWYVVWLYAGIAWIVTGLGGRAVSLAGKDVKIAEEPLLGVGFIAAFLFVAIFTSLRVRGAMSAVLVSVVIVGALLAYLFGWWGMLVAHFPDLRVHMNQAFYGVVFAVLFPVWLLSTFVFNRIRRYTFLPGGRVEARGVIGGGAKIFMPQNLTVDRLPDDIFIHRILGLWWLGAGTGDLVVTYNIPGGGVHQEVVTNVWRVDKVMARIKGNMIKGH